MGRIFREILARNTKPESHLVLWLEPTEEGFKLLCFKQELNKWVTMQTIVSWDDIVSMPDIFKDEKTLREALAQTNVADEVGFHYDGSVSAITKLQKVLERKYAWDKENGETTELLPSVDQVLETIIAKVWFEKTTITASGLGTDIYVGGQCGGGTATFVVKNFHPQKTSGNFTLAALGGVTISPKSITSEKDGSHAISVSVFTPTKTGQYGVKLTVVTTDADGNAESVSAQRNYNAYYPYYAWSSTTKQASLSSVTSLSSYKTMLKSATFDFNFKGGKMLYYNILVPFDLNDATQANTGDWTDKFTTVTNSFKIGSRSYKWYQTTNPVNSAGETVPVHITLTNYKD